MELETGRYYRSKKLGISAKLIEYDNRKAVLSYNNIRYRVPLSDLEPDTDVLIYDKDDESSSSERIGISKTPKTKSVDIDLHHFATLSDALDYLEKELNACLPRKTAGINIIHGKGDGTLRDSVRRYLSLKGIRYTPDPKNKGITVIQ